MAHRRWAGIEAKTAWCGRVVFYPRGTANGLRHRLAPGLNGTPMRPRGFQQRIDYRRRFGRARLLGSFTG